MRIYFAASLFTQAERVWNRDLAAAIKKHFPAAEVILPQDFDAKGKHDVAAAYKALFAECVRGIDRADVVLAIIDGAPPATVYGKFYRLLAMLAFTVWPHVRRFLGM